MMHRSSGGYLLDFLYSVRVVIGRAPSGTRVIHVPGIHEESFRSLCGSWSGCFEVVAEVEHVTAEGRFAA